MKQETNTIPAAPPPRRWPLLLILIGFGLGLFWGRNLLSPELLQQHHQALMAWAKANPVLAALIYVLVYVLVVAVSLPGATLLTLVGGFVFGPWQGGVLTVVGATVGAVLIFLAARSALGGSLRHRAGPWLDKLADGLNRDAASYLLLMRLVPAVPFFAANLVPSVLGVPLRTYVWTTAVGIIPGTFAYAWAGAGLDVILSSGQVPGLSLLTEPAVLVPILLLSALALLPVVLRRFRGQAS